MTRASLALAALFMFSNSLARADLPQVAKVEAQPLAVHVNRLLEAMDYLGTPVSDSDKAALKKALADGKADAVQKVLDAYCLMGVTITPESRVKVDSGPAKPVLVQGGWRQFLVKVSNEAGVTAPLRARSPQAVAVHDARLFGVPVRDGQAGNRPRTATPQQIRDRFLDMRVFGGRPMTPALSGLPLEYRILQLYSRDAGKRAAVIAFDVGQGSQDIGFRNDVTVTFDAQPGVPVTLNVLDENGIPTTAAFEIRDPVGRVYPSQAKRLAPDFAFHPQVYRANGEKIALPAGTYDVKVTRGPEYLAHHAALSIKPGADAAKFSVKLKRWVDPAKDGWWSGDHHIHAAGCAHYNNPSEGVHAPDMFRHILGEDLKVGANLTWGPCFDYQKQFFTGKIDEVSNHPYLLRYDVEVSGFGSHRSGHLCLLRLKSQIPPGGESKNHWPTLCLNTLKWAQKQGAVCGPAHSGWGLKVPGKDLPNYAIPPMDSIGACEYVVDITHMVEGPNGTTVPAVDFLSMVDTPYVWELNMWYHTLNCGYRARISGETDFPCIYGERVGLGRSYVKLEGKLNYDAWCEGIEKGRNYVSDGKSHIIDFKVNDAEMGVGKSELRIDAPRTVTVTAKVAARLNDQPNPSLRDRPYEQKPFWDIERARLGDSRNVKLELVINGYPAASKTLKADGAWNNVRFDNVKIDRSSWVALRILPSSHTNPVWVIVGDKPVHPSRRSAQWCLKSVEQLWTQKERFIAQNEMKDAIDAYNHARAEYRKIIANAYDDTRAGR